MKREEFLGDLRRALGRMPENEKRDVLYDYEEHFRAALAEGKTEEDVARALGNPRMIGKSYAIDALLERPSSGDGVPAASVIRAVLASISLSFFNLIFVLGPFLGLVGGMIGLWAGAISIPIAGVGVVLSPVAAAVAPQYVSLGGASPLFLFFAGVGVTGLGVLAVLGLWKLSQVFVQLTAAYVRFNARIVTRRK